MVSYTLKEEWEIRKLEMGNKEMGNKEMGKGVFLFSAFFCRIGSITSK